jgi:hypothetical protein
MSKLIEIKVLPNDRKKLSLIPIKTKKTLRATSKLGRRVVAEDFLKFLQKGLKENNLGLMRLKRVTIVKKRALGRPQPSTVMYEKGTTDNRSFYNLLEVRDTGRGVKVGFKKRAKHWSGLKIEDLAIIHAEGRETLPKRNPIQNALNRYEVKKRVPSLVGKLFLKKIKEIF